MEFDRVSEAFGCARRLDGAARASYLAGLEPELRREIGQLLEHHEAPVADALDRGWPAIAGHLAPATDPAPELEGFRILRQIGAGGMGTVFEAEQQQPRRRVAIKLLHLATEEGRRRFEREAQVLAHLRHPGIAEIHAQGTTATSFGSAPYLVMEMVDGLPLTAFARDLPLRERVSLLALVCDAVAHAHEHGVIHRDLKPSNILVTADGQPKVLDFGLARVLGGETLQTQVGHVLGTLSYMSPEQALGTPQAADTRTDVYALGVIAYEMIGGRLPLDLTGLTIPAAAQRLVTAQPPSLPGAGDLAHIVDKALAKEKSQRYATAGALADDLRRYLNDESVSARAASTREQLVRFVRRNRALVLGVGSTVVALAIGLVLALQFASRAATQERRARRIAAAASLQAAAAAERDGRFRSLEHHLAAIPAGDRGWEWRYLASRADQSVRFIPVDDASMPMAMSRDGSRVAFREPGWNIEVRSTEDGRVFPLAEGAQRAPGAALAFRGGRLLELRARPDGFVRIDSADGSSLSLAPRKRDETHGAFAATSDGAYLARVSMPIPQYSEVHLHEGATGRALGRIRTAHGLIEFDPLGKLLATCLPYSLVAVHGVPDLERVALLRGHTQDVAAVAFRFDAKRIATASLDHTVGVWDVECGTLLHRLRGHGGSARAVAFSPDGSVLASGDSMGTIRIWDAATGNCERILSGHPGAVEGIAFRPDGDLVSVARDGIRHWSLAVRTVLRAHRSVAEGNRSPYVYGVAFSPDGSQMASTGWDGTLRLYDVATRRQVAVLDARPRGSAVAYSPDGTEIVGATDQLTFFDASTGHELRRFPIADGGEILSVAFAPDGTHLVASNSSETVWMDARTGALVHRWKNGGSAHPRAALSPDGATVAHARGREILLHRVGEGGRDGTLTAPAGEVYDLAFSPDGRLLATAGSDPVVRVWDLDAMRERFSLPGHTAFVYALAFTPDGSRLFSGSDDTTIRVWNLRHGEECLELRGHDRYVFDLAVHPDGTTVASASGDNTLRIWSTRSDRDVSAAARDMREREQRCASRVHELKQAGNAVSSLARESAWDDRDRIAARNVWLEQRDG